MSERRSHHLSEEQLARYQDGVLAAPDTSHLEACPECNSRLKDLQSAAGAYTRYLASRASALPSPPRPWRTLDSLIAQHEAPAPRRVRRRWLIPALGTALCLGVAVGFLLHKATPRPSPAANELLSRSAAMALPANRAVSLRLHGRSLVRPAVLRASFEERDPDLAHLAALFAQARYSWQEPLSARSFQSWRRGLREKRDSVTVIHTTGSETAYRVRTDTPGILHSAALTLRANDLHPTEGAFQFEGEEPVNMEESGAAPPPPAPSRQASAPHQEPVPVETPATPADTLHVLAALNAIGADAGEPIELSKDSGGQVLVRVSGLSPDRLQQVAAALRPLPHVKLAMGATTSDVPTPALQTATPDRSSTGMPEALRQQFEDRLGGAIALQEMTDRVLEASGLAVARAHAIEVLATQFPPQTESALTDGDRDLLRHLQQLHMAALRDLTARLQNDLERILPAVEAVDETPQGPWQAQAPEFVAAAQQIDVSLNRLLAGSYSERNGEVLLNSLASQLAHLRQMIAFSNEHKR